MTAKAPRTPRRADALSKERIVEAATRILDADGEGGLTFRTLAAHLSTGSGAIHWHVADKGDLLATATDGVLARVLAEVPAEGEPREALRAFALGLFDAIDAHPWVGTQLSREPWRPALLGVFERVGGLLRALGVPEHALFDSGSALVNYVLGVAGQNAANARSVPPGGADRSTFLAGVAARWARLDPAEHPVAHAMAAQLRDHDDREQFLAGVDLILAGIETVHGAAGGRRGR
jgi:AcrR family transcriptional regulator